MSTRSRIHFIATAAVMSALMFAGCGDDVDDDGPGPVDSTVPSDTADADTDSEEPATEPTENPEDQSDEVADDRGALVPPGMVSEADTGNGTLYQSEAEFGDVVAHYDSVVGDALFVNQEEISAVWTGEIEEGRLSVNVSEDESGLLNILVAILD